ncbi:MAG: hypothetical protein KF894_20565 [Labilithrix sp.]|nr:hypothetical protein [Labilithrix sp.]
MAVGQKVDFSEYGIVKPELALMQHNKCCYCEKREEQAKFRDVEHYRPKGQYWWLAWTWENLLFACQDCNREFKRDRFPLSAGSRLAEDEPPPGTELPLVIDPCDSTVDPSAEIVFRRESVQRRERWRPQGLTARGRETIEVCGLDRPGLLDLYADHVNHCVRPKVALLCNVSPSAGARGVVDAWRSTVRGLLAPCRPFRSLAHDALEALVPASLRKTYNLELSRPR